MSELAMILNKTQRGLNAAMGMLRRLPQLFREKVSFRASVWSVTGYGTGQVIRFASNLILTRLLVPEVFGLMAIANSLLLGLSFFSDIGTHRSIIQNKRGEDPDFLNTAWTIQMIRGVVLFFLSAIAAYPMSMFYGDSRLLWLIPTLGLTSITWGLCSTALITLNRRMQVGRLALFEIAIQIIGLTVIIVLVQQTRSIQGLVIGMLVGEVFRVVGSHLLIKGYRNKLAWDREALHEIIHFGKWLMFSTAMTFLATQTDRLILGKYYSLTFIGIYAVAYTLSDVPRQVMRKLNQQVLLPEICRQLEAYPEHLRDFILKRRKLLLTALGFGISLMVAFGDLVIKFLFDDRYDQGAWILPLMSTGLWISALAITADPALYAIGKPKIPSFGNLAKFIYMLVAIPILAMWLGPVGAIIAIAWNDVFYYVAVGWGLKREKLSVFRQDFAFTLLLIPMIGVMVAFRLLIGHGTPLDTMPAIGQVVQEWLLQK